MAVLTHTSGLALRLEASGLDSGSVTTWTDNSPNANDFTTTAGTPTCVRNATPSGKKAVRFAGADYLTGPLQSTYLATNSYIFAVIKATSVATDSATAPSNDCVTGGSVQAGPGIFLRSSNLAVFYNNDGTQDKAEVAYTIGDWRALIWRRQSSTGTVAGSVEDAFNFTTTTSGAPANLASAGKIGATYNNAAFFTGDLAALLAYNTTLTSSAVASILNYLMSEYLTRGDSIEIARDVASRRQRRRGDARITSAVRLPLYAADVDLLTDYAVSHPIAPSAHGTTAGISGGIATSHGWRNATHEARPFRAVQTEVDLDGMEVAITGVDLRHYVARYADTLTPSGNVQPGDLGSYFRSGEAIVGTAPAREFGRDSNAWIVSPTDSATVIQISENREKQETDGTLIESTGQNYITGSRSAFVNGTSGLTLVGTGVNGSAIVASTDTTPLLFDSSITTNVLKFTAGIPHTTSLMARFPATASIGPTARVVVDVSGNPLNWSLLRGSDSRYFNSSSSWTSAVEVFNEFGASAVAISSTWSDLVPLDSSGDTLTLSLGLKSSGTSNRSARVYYVSILSSEAACQPMRSRHVASTAYPNTQADVLAVSDNSTRGPIPLDHGTILVKYIPTGYATEIANDKYIVRPAYEFTLYYRHATEDWAFSNGSAVATKSTTFQPGDSVFLAGRWTSTEGEADTTGVRTMSIFVNGVKGTDVTTTAYAYSALTTGAEYTYIGRNPAAAGYLSNADGWISNLVITPYVMTDEESAAWSST